jgi:hypothetical protein
MKQSLAAATAGILAGTALLLCTAPAMAHGRVGVGISIGLPVVPAIVPFAPVAYVAPPPLYGPPAVVYGGYYGYGPVVRVGGPYARYQHFNRGGFRGRR